MSYETDIKTRITLFCKDNTKRVITVIGHKTVTDATALGRDLEGNNLKYATVAIL